MKPSPWGAPAWTHNLNGGYTGLDSAQALRYSRQIKLPQLGERGQQRLAEACALVIGAGGLGSPAAMYLAAAGVGRLVISDFDRVEASNLQRQIIHGEAGLGEAKATSAKTTLGALNASVRVDALDYELDGEELLHQVRRADVVLDCTDNFPSRFALNAAAIETGTPWVSGAAVRWEGHVVTFMPGAGDRPCFRCLYPDENVEALTCAAEGIMGPVVGVIGSAQALEAIKLLLGMPVGLCGRLLLFDGLSMECQTVEFPRLTQCPACGAAGL